MNGPSQPNPDSDQAIGRLISRHYGDGGVYVPRSAGERETLKAAQLAGFVNEEGFLTRKGRNLVARL